MDPFKHLRSLTRHAEAIKKHTPTWLYKVGAQFYVDRQYPRHLFIETTAACNLTCAYCPRERRGEAMDFTLFKRIIDEASQFGPRSFSLHLFGEPLLWRNLYDGIVYIKHRNRKHTVLLTTNGTHLNEKIEELLKAQVDEIIWSWRKEAHFTEKTKTLLRQSKKFRVRILKEETPKEEIQRWSAWPNVEIRSLHNYGGQIDLSKWSVPSAGTRWPCYHLWFAPAVAWNGDIILCCADPHRKSKIGQFPKNSIAEAWKLMETTRGEHLAGKYRGICEHCDVWKSYPDIFFKWQKRS